MRYAFFLISLHLLRDYDILKLEAADTSQTKLMVKGLVLKKLWCYIGGKLKCKAQLYQLC